MGRWRAVVEPFVGLGGADVAYRPLAYATVPQGGVGFPSWSREFHSAAFVAGAASSWACFGRETLSSGRPRGILVSEAARLVDELPAGAAAFVPYLTAASADAVVWPAGTKGLQRSLVGLVGKSVFESVPALPGDDDWKAGLLDVDAARWVSALPRGPLVLSSEVWRAGARVRYGGAWPAPGCAACGLATTDGRHHLSGCGRPFFHSRHNGVRDLVARELRRLGLGVEVEPAVGAGRADLLVRFGDGRPNAFLDVTVRRGAGNVRNDERAAVEEKDALYGPVCRAAGAVFKALFVSPLGVVGPESRRLLDGVLGSGLRGSTRLRNSFYRSLSVGLQRALGLSYLSLLPRVE